MTSKPVVIIPDTLRPRPSDLERKVAILLARHFHSAVQFVRPKSNTRTADCIIMGQTWEIKSPQTDKINTLQKLLRHASTQSPNVVVDLRRSKMNVNQALSRLHYLLKSIPHLKHVLVVTKSNKVLIIK